MEKSLSASFGNGCRLAGVFCVATALFRGQFLWDVCNAVGPSTERIAESRRL